MSITAREARKQLFPLIKRVNEDHDAVEIVSRHGNAVLVSAEDYDALREGFTCCAPAAVVWRLSGDFSRGFVKRVPLIHL